MTGHGSGLGGLNRKSDGAVAVRDAPGKWVDGTGEAVLQGAGLSTALHGGLKADSAQDKQAARRPKPINERGSGPIPWKRI